ncbi:hypothetical protein JZ751_018821 [Albula glossodonta]|uniref:Uncharacterized protein n=1 Tax=Albula glossodonta TaxID=121402 RepID=A0A8T2NNW1_9TELE|nr:hypothetical protein JZ751_018821 [Albula glossodonta]
MSVTALSGPLSSYLGSEGRRRHQRIKEPSTANAACDRSAGSITQPSRLGLISHGRTQLRIACALKHPPTPPLVRTGRARGR